MYLVANNIVCVVAVLCGAMGDANFKINYLKTQMNCIKIAIYYGDRSAIDCALRASVMDYYGDSFVYRNGECYLCRANNVNCAALHTEIQVIGLSYYKG